MRVIFLGTNGWYDTETGNTSCILIETRNEYVILDAGSGFYKIDRFIKDKKPIYLFLSHLHLDHITGLHILAKFNFRQGINIYIHDCKRKFFDIVNEPYTKPISQLDVRINLHNLNKDVFLPFNFEFKKLLHSVLCYGFRFNLENKIVTYCTDTGVCNELYDLARDADLLMLECSYKPGQKEKGWPHLNPETAAKVAKKSKARRLALIHFDAFLYRTLTDRENAGKWARKIFKDTIVAKDDLMINL